MGGEPSRPDHHELTADLEAAPASLEPENSKRVTSLSRELADFLVEFSIVLHNRSMYPAGHPQLRNSAVRFAQRLNALLGNR